MQKPDKDTVRKLIGQITGMYDEISLLSKSKPDNPLNPFKLSFINEMLAEANAILGDEYRPLKNFSLFEETAIPTNSDAAFILSQYLARLKDLRNALL